VTRIAALCAILLCSTALTAQSRDSTTSGFIALDRLTQLPPALQTLVTLSMSAQPRSAILADIARQAGLSYIADRALPGMATPVTLVVSRVTVRVALQQLLAGSTLEALVGRTGQIVIRERPARGPRDDAQPTARQQRLSGFVRSAASNEVIRRAIIRVDDDALVRQSNEEGFYVLLVPEGTHRVRVRAIGFAPFDSTIEFTAPRQLDLVMRPQQVVLQAVQVASTRAERPDLDPRTPDMSVIRLDMKTTRLVPPMLGEIDPIRTLTLLPGVATTSDASTAFSVRGGGADQNLILLDESTVFNPSHILGFLSTFNADAVDDVTLYKGAIPARYGGRLSSVVDIRQREGNAKEFAGSASIGLLASRATVEGPMLGKRGSYMIAGRRSYADVFLGAARDTAIRDNRAYFYDLNLKSNVRLGQTGSLMASGYVGRDQFGQSSQRFGAGWGNRTATLRWNQAIGGRLYSKLTSAWSDYDYLLRFQVPPRDSARWTAQIRSADIKVDETYQLSASQRLEFGGEWSRQEFRPGRIQPLGDTLTLRLREVEPRYGVSRAAYLGHEVELGSRIAIRYGIRWADFARVGQGTRYRYANDAPVVYNAGLNRFEPGRLLDSGRVGRGDVMARYAGWEPRASARFSVTDRQSLKVSYAKTRQFLQLISNTNSPTPLDVWEPVGPFIRPQVADQYALGWSGQWRGLELTAEGYYKLASGVVDYIDGADVVLNPRLETLLIQGTGRAYGLELYARRTEGRLTGWVSYTLGRAEQRFPAPGGASAVIGGGINNGRWYPTPFDKTHNLSVVGVWQWTPKWTIGSTFLLATGLPVTLPRARYVVDDFLVPDFGGRNGARLPLYHRLDVSLTRTLRRGELQFGVLNAYNRFNAQALRVRQSTRNPLQAEAVQTSIFGAIPSINYVFRF
jgi:hypothetical protein